MFEAGWKMFACQMPASAGHVAAERAQQMVEVPRQDPGVEQRITVVGGDLVREARGQRPRHDERQRDEPCRRPHRGLGPQPRKRRLRGPRSSLAEPAGECGDIRVDLPRAPPAPRETRREMRRRAGRRRSPIRRRRGCRSRAAGRGRSPRRFARAGDRPAASRRRLPSGLTHRMPGMAFNRSAVSRARSSSAAVNEARCERSPRSAAAIAYCIGPGLHSRPSASFLIAANAGSRRGVRPTAIQPPRQPGARYAFESDE